MGAIGTIDSQLLGLIAVAIGLFLGLVGIAAAVFFGLAGFRSGIFNELRTFRLDILNELRTIREKIVAIEGTTEKIWDVMMRTSFVPTKGTVERKLANLGIVKITASPGPDQTVYDIEVEKAVLQGALIAKLGKETGFEDKEKEMFRGLVPGIRTLFPNRLRVEVPSVQAKVCTEYIGMFLRWLDSTYYESLAQISDFEQPIQI